LRSFGYRFIDSASDGLEALHKIKSGSYDLVFLDCYMPGMSGFEVTRTLRDDRNIGMEEKPVIVALTGNTMNTDRQKCLDAGMNDFLSKPYKQEDLARILEKWLPLPHTAS